MIRAAVAILQQEKRILICQRKKNSRYELKWEFPGGKVEVGESLLECLKRELREELSIEIDGIDRSESQVNRYDDGGDFEVSYFFVSRFTGTPTNNVFEQIRWVTLAELKSLDILEGNKPFVARLSEATFL
jgi:8-oxo-dGTP diphosphatase